MLSSIPPFQDEEEDLPYDVKSWFTNIQIEESNAQKKVDANLFEIDFQKIVGKIC